MNLSTALRNIHNDRFWWRKVLLGGVLYLSVVGAPWSAGLVTESLENILKGFPTPLPPSIDPATRYIIGLLSLIIDFFFFLLPLLLFGLIIVCAAAAFALGRIGTSAQLLSIIVFTSILVYECLVFAIGVAPIGRLIYVQQTGVERALGAETLRTALDPRRRRAYGRARIQSLPAYLPLFVLAALVWASTLLAFPGSWLLTMLLLWLALSALMYAHLVVVQLYGASERLLR